MKLIYTILLLHISLSIMSQDLKFALETNLKNQITALKNHEHGVEFLCDGKFVKANLIIKKLEFIQKELHLKQREYIKKTEFRGKHHLHFYIARSSRSSIRKIIEIKSNYISLNGKCKEEFLNYFIYHKNALRPIVLSFDVDGLSELKLRNKDYDVVRESVVVCDEKFFLIENGVVLKNEENKNYESFRTEVLQFSKIYK